MRVLITGSEGLVGSALARHLGAAHEILRLDLQLGGDVCSRRDVHRAVARADGIVHLAAVSRVVWGERAPALCWETNVGATRAVLEEALASRARPWVLVASSREVYGDARDLPVTEDAPLAPRNVYGRSKREAEQLVATARQAGLRAAVARLSNVYGSARDHADRVIPAFVRAAAQGTPLRLDGPSSTFDFTHVSDAARGLARITELLAAGERPPPIHLLTGVSTSLRALAELTLGLAGSRAPIVEAAPRAYDVAHFAGDPSRAEALLGWRAEIPLPEGLSALLADLQAGRRAA